MMTSLHVICGWDPPIKNPGYAYGILRAYTYVKKRMRFPYVQKT